MTRVTITVIVIFVALGAIFFFSRQAQDSSTENKNTIDEVSQIVPVVFAAKNIKQGQIFENNLLEERNLPRNQIPSDAILNRDLILERRAGRDIPRGIIIAPNDVLASDRLKWTADDERREIDSKRQIRDGYGITIYPIRIILAGKKIDSLSITAKQTETKAIPPGSIGSFKDVIGRTAKSDLLQGQIIREMDLE